MNKFIYLSTCDTCKRILKALDLPENVVLQDIKYDPVSVTDLEHMRKFVPDYESLFNKRSRLYKEQGLKDKNLTDEDYKRLILEHYTFLKRPVLLADDAMFAGNSKNTIEDAVIYVKENLRN
ncbi:arsenate reductase family protein [Robertkochia solimangrovi]|uniref:arsenate reductase family protein n=1 Tax=Robertkochia solimangrovi TaxID=2213046 RepID=UPI001180A8BA|nr:ArsC/Spx/MgsR family protein [Robertkochia solimangrovi]TRZ45858.1 hypothetical protein DMZ48_00840 [Robertkochia solimangrovi]